MIFSFRHENEKTKYSKMLLIININLAYVVYR